MDKKIASITEQHLQEIKELENRISSEVQSKVAIIAYEMDDE